MLAELYHKTLRLPVKWHQDHHSGAIINYVRKAQEALRHFFERGIEYLHTFFKFIFSFAAIIWFPPFVWNGSAWIGCARRRHHPVVRQALYPYPV
jgi:ABC-type multidrug transport system fused ATPase/permease subunit